MSDETLFKTEVKPKSNSKNFSLYESVRTSVQNYLHSQGESKKLSNLYELVLAEMEIPLFEKVLEYTNGFETRTAKILGIARGTLRTKLKHYDIDRRDYKWPKYKGEQVEEDQDQDQDQE